MSLTERFSFIKGNSQFFYSLLLIILIPSILAFNTLFIVRAIDRDMNTELRSKANLVGSIIAPIVSSNLDNPTGIENSLQSIITSTKGEIVNISVLIPNTEGDKFNVLVSSDKENSKRDGFSLTNQLSWSDDKSYATQIYGVAGDKLWTVVAPVKTSEGKKIALINVKVSTALAEKIINRTIQDSLLIVLGTVFVVLLLLLNHIRFFETSVLFSRLKEVNKLKDVFISVASHELLSPMTAIKGYLELLKESTLPKTQEVGDNVKYLSENFDRLQELVLDLLDVSRLENNKVIMTIKSVSMEELIKETLTQFALLAKEKKLNLNYNLKLALPDVLADERRLRQVLTNIISNAIKYTKTGGLTISHELKGKNLITNFRDTGIGIPDSERGNLFQKFYRIRVPETASISGTGLGLWLIKQFIEKMGGKIYLESIENTGTQITVELPIAKSAV